MRRRISQAMPIWQAAVQHARVPVGAPVTALIAVVVVGFLGVLFAGGKGHQLGWASAATVAICAPAAVYGTSLFVHILRGIGIMGTPAHARLSPGFAPRMRRAGALALLVSLLPWLAQAAAFPRQAHFILLAVAYLYALALVQFWIGHSALSYFWVAPLLAFQLLPAAALPWLESPLVIAALCTALAWLGWRSFNVILPHQGRSRPVLAFAPSLSTRAALLEKGGCAVSAKVFARQLAMNPPMARLVLLFGPGRHAGRYWPTLAIFVLSAAALEWLVTPLAPAPARLLRAFVVVMMPVMFWAQTVSMVAALRATAGEQSLFRLAARAPQASRLNAALAARFVRGGITDWLITCAALLAVAGIFDAPAAGWMLVVSIMLAMLALPAWTLRDYARGAPARRAAAWLAAAFGLLLAALLVLSALTVRRPDAWLLVQALLLACSLGAIARRWHVMVRSPVAFPARRMEAGRAP